MDLNHLEHLCQYGCEKNFKRIHLNKIKIITLTLMQINLFLLIIMKVMASAFYPSPFDEACILTVDGVGEWL